MFLFIYAVNTSRFKMVELNIIVIVTISVYSILICINQIEAKIEVSENILKECESEEPSIDSGPAEKESIKFDTCAAACTMKAINLMNAKGKINISAARRMVRENVDMTKWQDGYDVIKRCSRKANKGENKCITAELWISCSKASVPTNRLFLSSLIDALTGFLPSPTIGLLGFISF